MLAKILVSNDRTILNDNIEQIITDIGITQKHPDLLTLETEKLNLEQAKKVKEFFTFKPHQAKGRVVVIKYLVESSIEAQNALLKTIEELPSQSLILIVTNQESIFLPTILSRCEIVKFSNPQNSLDATVIEEVEQFIKLSVQEKFYYIEKIKNKNDFLLNLTYYFQSQLTTSSNLPQTKLFLEYCLEAEKWSRANVNIRGILEYLALKLP